MDGTESSPIPWPRSDKKRKPGYFTPESRDSNNKLSSKKNSGRTSIQSTPRRSLSKWLKPNRSSIETFNRIYNEITNSPTSDGLGSGCTKTDAVQCSTGMSESKIVGFCPTAEPKDKSYAFLKGRKLKRTLLDSGSDSCDNSISSTKSNISTSSHASSFERKESSLPRISNKHKPLIDSSSDDDDSFCLPPPLHERIPLVSTANCHGQDNLRNKTKQNKLLEKAKGKENVSALTKNFEKAIVIDDSSSEDDLPDISICMERREIPVTLYTNVPALKCKLPVSPRVCISETKRTTKPILIFDDSSSSESERHGATTPYKRNTNSQTAKCLNPLLQKTVPKYFKPNGGLATDIAGTSNIGKDPIRIDPKQAKRRVKPLIFDTSSESELPDVGENKTTKKILPVSNIQKTASSSSQVAGSPKGRGTIKLWISKEQLTESSRFLKSLSDKAPLVNTSAHFRNKFSKHKDDLVKKLYQLFNGSVFENKLPADMSITWNIRLTKTAGYCYMRCHKDQTRTARIELSLKVLDSAERVRDTLLHEMCHAAAFIIHGYRDGHGPLFKFWGQKAGVLFPFLPVVSRCHTYSINTKYLYRCTRCKASIGRHSKSLDMSRKACGRCGGRFELLVNGVLQNSAQKTSDFAKFVKENYKQVKDINRTMKHGDLMQKLGIMFAEKAKI